MSIEREQVTGLILAGGLGSRMGGMDKGLLVLAGLPMAQHVLNRLQPQVGPVLINANRHLSAYRAFGAPVCSDVISGYAGPLAGIHAGLRHCRTDYLLSVPCDSPLLPPDLAMRLAAALQNAAADAAVAVTGHADAKKRHPVFMLIRTALKDSLAAHLDGGGRKVGAWLASVRCVDAHFDDDAAFVNINNPHDLETIAVHARPA